jgi:hypothetical protein
MSLCIVQTPQDDDNSLPELLARPAAPASGRAPGPGAGISLAFTGIGAVGMARIVAMAVVVVLTTISSAIVGTIVSIIRAGIAEAAGVAIVSAGFASAPGVAIVRAIIIGAAILIVVAVPGI